MRKRSRGRAFGRTAVWLQLNMQSNTHADFRGGPINFITVRGTKRSGRTIQSNHVRSLGRPPRQRLSLTGR